ncbi:MAG: isocitrate/isopropylmalate dehydrogenase family protein [Deltaproteobacteria bacterium]|nr:isocitrate/isopropylmalate dehydrogenase family protein [Deltaproteobacteria bacterium]
MTRRRIAVIPGDGIGKEVIHEGCRILKALDEKHKLGLELIEKDWGADKWLAEGVGIPQGGLDDLQENYDGIFFGALGDPRIPDMAHGREILLGMRFGLDLYMNQRPCKVFIEELCPLKNKGPDDVDFVIMRENTEDLYVSMGGRFKKGTPDEVAIDESMNTYKGVERIVRAAFEYAVKTGRKSVTLADKSNAVRHGGGLWQDVFKEVAADFKDIETQHRFVDVMAMELVTKPEIFDVVVANNLFGDILSDIGAGLTGSLGLAASANLHPGRIGLFEPVHGSAPDIVGQQKANPMATFLTAAMMLEFLDAAEVGKALNQAVLDTISAGEMTADLGGSLNTKECTDAVMKRLI